VQRVKGFHAVELIAREIALAQPRHAQVDESMRERRLAEKAVRCRCDALYLVYGRLGFVQFRRIAHILQSNTSIFGLISRRVQSRFKIPNSGVPCPATDLLSELSRFAVRKRDGKRGRFAYKVYFHGDCVCFPNQQMSTATPSE